MSCYSCDVCKARPLRRRWREALEHDGVCRASAGGGIIGGEQTVAPEASFQSLAPPSPTPPPPPPPPPPPVQVNRNLGSVPGARRAIDDDDVRYAMGGPGAVDTVASSSLETAHREDFGGLAKWEEVQHEYCNGPMLLSRRLQP